MKPASTIPAAMLLVVVLLTPSRARPQSSTPSPSASMPPPADPLATAKDLFRNGVALLNAGDVERALDRFLRSREAFASSKNTTNAAICLDRLGRYDEALEMYEDVLTRFSADLDAEDRASIGPAMAALRPKVGAIDISANVQGTVVLDGRPRGKLPLTGPIRARGGERILRIVKDGYATFETKVAVQIGTTVRVDARLQPLAEAGQLRIEDPGHESSEIFVDRMAVGVSPWEGTLGPGKHVVWTRKGDVGSAPIAVIVVQGQTALVRVRSGPLGSTTRIDVEPPTAEVSLNGVSLGSGGWEGRLPLGKHELTISEPGYRPSSRVIVVAEGASAGPALKVKLDVDPNHPRWPKASASGRVFVDAFGGYAVGATFGGDVDSKCPGDCSTNPTVGGPMAGLRAGYRFPVGLAFEIGGGYASLREPLSRTATAFFTDPAGQQHQVTYQIHDDLRVNGPFATGGASYRLGLSSQLGLVARTSVGVLFARSTDPLTGDARTDDGAVKVTARGAADAPRSAAVFVLPELGAEIGAGRLHLSLSLGVGLFLTDGPRFDHSSLAVASNCPTATQDPGAIGCAPGSAVLGSERAYGTFVVWVPEVGVGYAF